MPIRETAIGVLDERYLKLDQTTPQTVASGVPLMTTAVNPTGSGNQLVNMDYVKPKLCQFTHFV